MTWATVSYRMHLVWYGTVLEAGKAGHCQVQVCWYAIVWYGIVSFQGLVKRPLPSLVKKLHLLTNNQLLLHISDTVADEIYKSFH